MITINGIEFNNTHLRRPERRPVAWIIYLAIILLTITGNKLIAQVPEEYLLEAAENNPELRAYFNEYLSALEVIPQVGSLPDPELTFGYFTRPMEFTMGNQRAELSLMQMFPWFGTLRANRDEASRMAWARYEVFRDMKNQLYLQVKSSWYELYELEREIAITENNLDLLRTLEQITISRFQGGSSGSPTAPSSGGVASRTRSDDGQTSSMSGMGNMQSQPSSPQQMPSMPSGNMQGGGMSGMPDVLRVKMEINEIENMLAGLKDDRGPLTARFNKLLNRPLNDGISVADSIGAIFPLIDENAILDSITKRNPMIRMLDDEEEVYEIRQRMATLMGRPMLGAGINYMIFSPDGNNGPMSGTNMMMPMVRLTIPIFRGKYRAMEREAEFMQASVVLRRDNMINNLSVEAAEILRDLSWSERTMQLYRDQMTLAEQTLNILITAYSTGSTGFEEVLRMQKQLLDYRLGLLKTISEHNRTVARLEMLTASGLENEPAAEY
jgi:outer membrane protein TolC